jgi:Lrp/AsnC family leucine-responsive transcriptional regulator
MDVVVTGRHCEITERYRSHVEEKLTRLDNVASIESSFALSQVKYSIALPV